MVLWLRKQHNTIKPESANNQETMVAQPNEEVWSKLLNFEFLNLLTEQIIIKTKGGKEKESRVGEGS